MPLALYYAREIADGVDAAHELSVIHRDLKPENIFITRENATKVLDFGTGKFIDQGLKTTDRMRTTGTYAYMSPEALRHGTGRRADGRLCARCCALEMLAGRHPFADKLGDARELGVAHMHQAVPPLADVPLPVGALVMRAMAKKRTTDS